MHAPPRPPPDRLSDDPDPTTSDTVPVSSPCIGVCRLDERAGYCTGCLRTLGEIASWGRLDGPSRRALLGVLQARRDRVSGARAAGSSTST